MLVAINQTMPMRTHRFPCSHFICRSSCCWAGAAHCNCTDDAELQGWVPSTTPIGIMEKMPLLVPDRPINLVFVDL